MVDIVDLRNLVAEAEGTTDERAVQENFASGYDLPFGYGRYLQPSKPISQMTFKELADFQRRQVNATKGTFDNTNRGTSAVGRYQFIGPTLENLKNRLGYKDTDVFSPEVQDRLFDALMEEQGLQELSAGLITPEEFQEKLSSQFASIPKPGTETGTYKGQGTGVTSDRVSAVLSSMQDPSGGGDTFRPEDDTVPSDTGTVTSDQAEEEPGFLDTVGEYLGDAVDTVGEYASDAYDTASEYVGETVDTLEGVAESVGEKLRRLLGLEEDQSSSATGDNPPLPTRRPTVIDNPPLPTRRPTVIDNPPLPGRRPTVIDNPPLPQPRPENLRKAEGGSVEKEVKFGKKDDDDDVPDPPPGATPEEVADDIPAYLSTGEYVLPANVVRYIGLKNIADMHRMALAELQQMEDLGIIENVDENGYVEDDDDETEYMEPEGVVEVIVAEHHPKGLMAMGFANGGGVGGSGDDSEAGDPGAATDAEAAAAEAEAANAPAGPDTGGYGGGVDDGSEDAPGAGKSSPGFSGTDKSDVTDADVAAAIDRANRDPGGVHAGYESVARDRLDRARRGDMSLTELAAYSRSGAMALDAAQVAGYSAERAVEEAGMTYDRADEPGFQGGNTRSGTGDPAGEGQGEKGNTPDDEEVDTDTEKLTDTDSLSDYTYVPGVGYRRTVKGVKPLSKLKYGGYVTRNGIMARGFAEGGMLNSDSLNGEEVLPTSDIFSKGVYAQANIDRSVDSDGVVESDKVITAPVAFSSAPGKTAYLAYITPEEAASLRQAKQGFSPEGSGQEVSPDQYQHIGPKGLMSFNGDGESDGPSDVGDPEGGPGEPPAEREPEVVEEEEKPTDLYEGYTYVDGIGYVPTSRRMTSDKPVESASLALSSIFTPSFLQTIGLMSDPNKEV